MGQDSKMEGSKWHAKKESVYYQAGDTGEGYSEDWQSDWGPAYYEEPDDEGKRVRPGPSFILLLLWSAIHRHHHHPRQSPRRARDERAKVMAGRVAAARASKDLYLWVLAVKLLLVVVRPMSVARFAFAVVLQVTGQDIAHRRLPIRSGSLRVPRTR